MNTVDIILLILIAAAVCGAVYKLVSDRKKGRCACGQYVQCGCKTCGESCRGCGKAPAENRHSDL